MSSSYSADSDPSGLETLELFSDAARFNQWMFDAIAPYCKGNVIEIGSGVGNISAFLLDRNEGTALSDLRYEYCSRLKERFSGHAMLRGIHQIDLSITDFEKTYPALLHQFDTLIALNVIEHIEDADLAIYNCRKLLKPGGRLIILVPAYQVLYNKLDKELGHYRRYTIRTLEELFRGQGLKTIHKKYFNFTGIPGWWFTGVVLRKKIIPRRQLKIYNKLVPVFRVMDNIIFNKAGLSVIGIAITDNNI